MTLQTSKATFMHYLPIFKCIERRLIAQATKAHDDYVRQIRARLALRKHSTAHRFWPASKRHKYPHCDQWLEPQVSPSANLLTYPTQQVVFGSSLRARFPYHDAVSLEHPIPAAMSYPAGIRDGPFIRFDGWDVPGNDVGQYFKDLGADARIAKLKEASVEYGSPFFAFNTNGWSKSWDTISPSKFVNASNSSLWIRVDYPGWVFYPRKLTFGIYYGAVGQVY